MKWMLFVLVFGSHPVEPNLIFGGEDFEAAGEQIPPGRLPAVRAVMGDLASTIMTQPINWPHPF